jgi:hypothetical protein
MKRAFKPFLIPELDSEFAEYLEKLKNDIEEIKATLQLLIQLLQPEQE